MLGVPPLELRGTGVAPCRPRSPEEPGGLSGRQRTQQEEDSMKRIESVKIQPGDVVEVKGSRVTMAGKPALIAAEVKKGDETLRLRDETGVPVWTGWRRG
jgi:hypothetical protein